MSARTWAFVIAAGVVAYLVLAGWRGWFLITSGDPVAAVMGVAVLVIPVIGAWLLWRELAFGFGMQDMGRALDAEGGLPADDLPRTASGRVDRDAADAAFAPAKAGVEAAPEDWRAWYRLGIAYDDARDRRRARAAMRRALALYRGA